MHIVTKIKYKKCLKGKKKAPANETKDSREVTVKSKKSLRLEFL